ncbi:MAG: hypothetical protein AAGA30_16045, partial [Planctomycetota bacterium]
MPAKKNIQAGKDASGRDKGSKISRRSALTGALVTTMSVAWSNPALGQESKSNQKLNKDRPVGERLGTSDSPVKRRARNDYQRSLRQYKGRLSS